MPLNKSAMWASTCETHRDCVLANEARQAASAVPDGKLCAVLNVCGRLLWVVTMVKPWWEKSQTQQWAGCQNVCVNTSITKILLNRASEVTQTIRTQNTTKRLHWKRHKNNYQKKKKKGHFMPFSLGVCRCSLGLLHVCVQGLTAIFGFKNGSCYCNNYTLQYLK